MVNNYTDPDPTKSNNKKKFKNFLGSILYTKNPYPVFKIISLYQDPLTSYHLEPDSSANLGMIRILITSEKNSSFCFVVLETLFWPCRPWEMRNWGAFMASAFLPWFLKKNLKCWTGLYFYWKLYFPPMLEIIQYQNELTGTYARVHKNTHTKKTKIFVNTLHHFLCFQLSSLPWWSCVGLLLSTTIFY